MVTENSQPNTNSLVPVIGLNSEQNPYGLQGISEIAFVDSQLPDYQNLIAGLDRNVQIFVLDKTGNEFNQITQVLGNYQNLDAIHLFTHGFVGGIQLGNDVLNTGNLAGNKTFIHSLGNALSPDGDLLFYGCNVGAETTGQAFLKNISKITGADVAGSTNLTGNTALGGDWTLEYATGSIETHSLSNSYYKSILDSVSIDSSGKLVYQGGIDNDTDVIFKLSTDKQQVLVNWNEVNYRENTAHTSIDVTSRYTRNASFSLASITNGISIDVGRISTSQVLNPGRDTVTIESIYTNGGDLYINGGPASSINVNGVVSTRKMSTVGDPETSASIGNSGAISFKARTININNGKLLTNVITPNLNNYQAGNITINVEETWGTTLFGANFGNTAKLNLNSAIIKGGNVIFDAYTAFTPKDGNTGEAILEFLDNFALFGGVAIAPVTSEINIDASSSIDAANFIAKAQADGDATISTFSAIINIRVSYGKVDSNAKVNFAGKLTTSGNVDIQAIANNKLNVAADTTAVDPKQKWALGVAVSQLDSDALAQITDTAILNIGGNLDLKSTTIDTNSTYARAATGPDGAVAIATAVSIENGTTSALLDSKNTQVTGNINVNAFHRKGDPISSLAGPKSGVVAYGSTNATTTGDVASDAMDTVILYFLNGGPFPKKTDEASKKAENSSKKPSALDKFKEALNPKSLDKLDFVAGFAYHSDTNNAIARIGENANVTSSNGAIDIEAEVRNRPDISATSLIGKFVPTEENKEPPKVGISAAVPIGDYENNATAYIGANSQVNAKKSLDVTAQTINEYEFNYGKNIYDAFTKNKDDSGNDLTFGQKANNVISSFSGYLNNNAGLDKYVFDSWSQSTAGGGAENFGGAASVTILNISHNSQAYIGDHAQINQNTSLRSDQQTVNVQAFSVNESVNFSGNIQLPGITGNATGTIKWADKKKFFQGSTGGAGTDNQNSAGASAFVITYNNDVSAKIGQGVVLYADSLKVDTQTKVLSVDVVASGGKSKDKGLNGAFAWTYINNNTIAQINSGAIITVGNNLIDSTGKSLLVNAQDDMGLLSIIGGVAVSNSIGAGVSAGVNNVKRNTAAFIGTSADQAPGTNTNINVDGDAAVTASSNGGIWAFSLAAAVVEQEPAPTTPPPEPSKPSSDPESDQFDTSDQINLIKPDDKSSEVPMEKVKPDSTDTTTETKTAQSGTTDSTGKGQQGKSGFAFAGDVAVNLVEDNVRAYINTAGIINTKQLSLVAVNKTSVISASGAAAFVTPSAQGTSAGIAGSFSYNKITGATQAFIAGTNSILNQTLSLTTTGLTLDAQRSGLLIAVTAGGSGAASQDGYAIAGSVSINKISNDTSSYITGIIGRTGAATLSATDSSSMWVVAGALAYGGKSGIGAAVAVNQISNSTRSSIENSTLTHSQGLSLSSSNDSNIQALSASVGIAKDKLGAAGTVSVNRIGNTTTSKLVNFNNLYANGAASTGAISLSAKDDSTIWSLSGAVGIGDNTGIGAAAAYNAIGNNVTAYVQSSNIATSEGLTLAANSDADIKTASVGVGGGKQLAFAGSLSINQINNTVAAYIKDAKKNPANPSQSKEIKTGKAITINASDDSSISSLSGGVAISTSGSAAGAAVSINAIGDNNDSSKGVKAYIDNADVSTTGNYSITLAASNNAHIGAIALGAAGGENFALGGSVALNNIESQADAHISNNANLQAVGAISITAEDTSDIQALAGAVGISLSKSAVAASVSINDINNRTQAYVDKATVNSTGNFVKVGAKETATIQAITAGGSGAGDNAIGGSVSINRIGNHTTADIRNQSNVNAGNQVTVSIADTSTIQAIAGAVALGGKNAVGASIAFNKIDNQTQATIDNSQINSQSLSVNSNQAATVEAISAAGSGGGKAAISGAINLNFIDTVTAAGISNNANVTTSGLVAIAANDNSVIKSLAGQISIGGTAGVGVSVSTNFVDNQVTATISNSQVTSTGGNISLNAKLAAGVKNATVGASVGGTAGVAGAASVNNINTVTDAHISDSSTVKAAQLIEVIASDAAKDVPTTGDEAAFSGIQSLAGQVSIGGTGGVGASVSTNFVNNTVKAYIDKSTANANNITISATSTPKIENITAGGAGGGTFAAGGSVTVNNIGTQTLAYISNNSTIQTQQDINISANNTATIRSLAGQVSGGGTAAIGAAVAVNNSSSTTAAYISGSSVTSTSGTVKVAATGDSTIESLSAGASVSEQVALTGSVSVNNITDTIKAYALNGNITANNLNITSQDDATIKSLAGQVSASGGASVGAAVAYNNISNNIQAYSQDSTINTAGNVLINADNQGTIETVATGASVGLYAGIAGSVAVNQMSNSVSAYLQGGTLTAQGSVGVLANSVNTLTTYGGTLSGGLAGVGGTVVVNNVDNSTNAYLTGATINALGNQSLNIPKADGSGTQVAINGLGVIATSKEDLSVIIGTVSGGAVGIGVSAVVNSFTDKTKAEISGGLINGNNIGANSQQGVYVKAFNDTDVNVKAGTIAVGAVGLGAAIDVTTVKNATSASINNATVNTLKDVDVEAKIHKNVNSLTVAAGGGVAVGVQGTVSVLNVGSAISDQGNEATNNTQSTVSNQLSGLDGMGKDSSGKSNISTKKDVLNNFTPSVSVIKGTTAFISGTVNAGGEITILSDETSKVGITSGALALGGFAGVGGSVGIANVTHNSFAYVGANSNLTVGGNLTIKATGLVDSNKVQTIAGAGGLIGLGAAVSYLTSYNNTSAYIDSGARINQANNISVIAGSSSHLTAESWGAAVGVAAVGIVISNAEESGTTQAYLGNGVQIQNANSLNVNATAKEAVSATAQASSGGILSGNGAVPTATVSPTIKAYIGDNNKIQVTNDVTIISDVTVDGDAEAKGISIGLLAVGVSIAEVNAKPNIDTHIGTFTTIDATNITVQSRLGNPITVGDTSFDPSNAINNSQDTIKFNSNHGLETGDQVVYINGGTDISGLTNQSSYNVIAVDSQTVKLGSIFNAADIDVKFNTIKFAQNHGFKDGDKVVYESTGGNVIGGLVAGKTYYAKVVDSKTIKLSLTQSTTQLTQGTGINNINTTSPDTVVTINNHGFKTSDQINYTRRTAKFSIVDKLPDTQGKDNIFNLGSNVISNNTINSASHGFEKDDQVVYTTDGGVLGGLVNAQTYYIVNKTTNTFQLSATKGGTAIDITSVPTDAKGNVVDSTHQIKAVGLKVQQVDQSTFSYTTDNPTNTITLNSHGFTNGQAVVYKTAGTALSNLTSGTTYYVKLVNTNSFQLTATSGGAVIDIGVNSGTHQLVVNKGTQDLEEGVPYYVVGVTTNTFKLANTAAGTALTLDKSSLTGTGLDHLFTKENVVDLTSAGTGTQNLHIDLDNATATGKTHLLSSGATATIPTQGDNKFSAYSQAAAGGLLGGTGTKATLNISPTMNTYVGNNAGITAKGNVTVDSLSSVQTTGSTTSKVVGAIAVGAAKINVNVTNNNTTYVGDATSIIADGNVIINGQTAQTIDVSGDGGAGSLITFADAEAYANLTYNNNTYIGNYATIIAKNDLTINSTSNTDGKVKASADGVGIYADADADSSFNVDGSNLTNINSNVKLEGRTVKIQAIVDQLNVESRSEAEGAGLIGNIDAHADVNLDGTGSNVNINSGAYIKGDYIDLDAKFNTVNSNAIALADCDGLGGDTDTDATNNMPLTAKISTDSASTLEVYKLNVESDFTNFNKTTTANSDLAWSITIWTPFGDITITLDFGTESKSETYKPTPIIDFNSNVKLLSRETNPVLIVDQNGNIIQQSDNVTANVTATDVTVNDIDNASVGGVNFIIPNRTSEMSSNGKFTDKGKYTIIDPAYDTVDIQNYSNKNLIINDISVINPGATPLIKYDVNVSVSSKTIATTGPNLSSLPVNPTIVTINNWGNSDLILQGVIDNPHDRTILYSTNNIFSQGTSQNIITRDLTMTAVNGSIGTNTQRIKSQLNQGYSVVTPEVPSSKIYLETTAQKSVYLDLTAKQLDTNPITVNVEKMTASTGEVNLNINQSTDKSGANVTALYDVSNEYNLDNTIKAPSNIIAGTNITINAGTTTSSINGRTDFLGNGLLDVVTGGYINLTELNGGVNLYRAISNQDYITITVNESANTGEDLLLVDNAVVKAAKDVTFLVGDNFQIQPTATITADNNVIIKGDYGNQDPAGTLVNIYGGIYAQSMSIYGESNKDTFNIRRLATRTNLWAGGDDDIVNVGSNQPQGSGTVDEIQKRLTVYGEGQNNIDTLNIDDWGDISNNVGVLTDKSLTGLDMGEGIYYNNFELFNLKLGTGNDDLTVLNTGATTNIDANSGDDKLRFGPKVDANGNVLAETVDGVNTPGQNILGTSHITNVNTGDGKDYIQVNRNTAVLNIQAGNSDDTLEVNTPIYNSTLLANGKVNFSGDAGSDKTIVNGSSVAETINVNGASAEVKNSRVVGLTTNESLVVNGNLGNDTVNIDTGTNSNITNLQINANAGSDSVNLFSLLSTITATINGNQDNDTFTLGSQTGFSPTLNTILGNVNISGNDGTDVLTLNDLQDSSNNTGTLTNTTVTGLGLNSLTYSTLETLNLNLGTGNDTLTVQSTHTGDTNIKANAGNDQVNIRANSGNTNVWLGQGNDTINVGSQQPSSGGTVNQITKALTIYGEGQTTNDVLNVDDSGDTTNNNGVLTKDNLTGLGMGVGISYYTIETLNINLGSGADTFTSLDTGAVTNLNTGAGNDTVRIGPNLDANGNPLSESTPVLAANLIYGTSYGMTVNTGAGNDAVRVNRNVANLTLNGGDGNDSFELNTASNSTSSPGLSANGNVTLDGGTGADSIVVNGSSRAETIQVSSQGVQVNNSRNTTFSNVESLTVNGNQGSDDITVNTNGSSSLTQIQVNGGLDNDTLAVTSLLAPIKLTMLGDKGNDTFRLGNASNLLSQILGAVTIDGGSETDSLVLNHQGDNSGKTGIVSATSVTGFSLGSQGVSYLNLEDLTLSLGNGADNVTVNGTHSGKTTINTSGGNDIVTVNSISGLTMINVGNGDDQMFTKVTPSALGLTFIDPEGKTPTISGKLPTSTTPSSSSNTTSINKGLPTTQPVSNTTTAISSSQITSPTTYISSLLNNLRSTSSNTTTGISSSQITSPTTNIGSLLNSNTTTGISSSQITSPTTNISSLLNDLRSISSGITTGIIIR